MNGTSLIVASSSTSLTISNNYSYNILGSGYIDCDDSLGGSGVMYLYRRPSSVIHYTQTNDVYNYNGTDLPVFMSHRGKEFIFLTSRTGVEYKKYLK